MDYNKYIWGFEMTWADTELYSAHMIVVLENEKTPYQYHKKRDKTIFVLQGTIQLVLEENNKMLNEGEKYHIPPKVMHRVVALKGDATILEAGTKEENDIIIVEE